MSEAQPPAPPFVTEAHDDNAPTGRHLDDLVATVNLGSEIARLRESEPWRGSGRHATTLIKDAGLRVVLIALRSGARLEEHHAPGRITIHALDGALTIRAADQAVELGPGELLTLGPGIPHDVEARLDSAILLTIAWPAERPHL